jgi:carbonic anhydrase
MVGAAAGKLAGSCSSRLPRSQDVLDAAPDENARWRRLCELNVMAQVHAVREAEIVKQAWRKDYPVVVHGGSMILGKVYW